jgi:hypothetical protein
VIVTTKDPAVVELHPRVPVPELVMLAGVMAPHVSPLGTVSVRLTTPVKPFNAATVIVEVPVAPTFAEGDVAAIVKSVTVNVAVAECVRVPLVPVIVTT